MPTTLLLGIPILWHTGLMQNIECRDSCASREGYCITQLQLNYLPTWNPYIVRNVHSLLHQNFFCWMLLVFVVQHFTNLMEYILCVMEYIMDMCVMQFPWSFACSPSFYWWRCRADLMARWIRNSWSDQVHVNICDGKRDHKIWW